MNDMRKQRTRSSSSRKWLAGLVLVAIAAAGCSSTTAPAGRPSANFGRNLSLAISLGNPLAAGDKSATVGFALTNNGSQTFNACFGEAWGVSIIVGGHDAGHFVRADYPKCAERLTLLPHQTMTWSKTIPLNNLSAGPAKVTGWVRVVDPNHCDPSRGCHDVSVASSLQRMTVGER